MVDPALSSVVQPGFDMGIAATQLLLKKINGNHDGPQFIQLKTSLKIRESSRKNSVRNSK
jgi:LacI family transcriptional regulator